MSGLSRTFGETPRTRMLEALIRLGSSTVTRGELAAEAGLWRGSVNRVIASLEEDGLVTKVRAGKRPLYRASSETPEFYLLAHVSAALDYFRFSRPDRLEGIAISDSIMTSLRRLVEVSQLTNRADTMQSNARWTGNAPKPLPRIEILPNKEITVSDTLVSAVSESHTRLEMSMALT